MNKNILVASYYFPPYPGIGGRRMAKFCKYLIQKGYTVHVIKVENHHTENSHWFDDVGKHNLKLYSIPVCYPEVLMMASDTQKKKRTFLERIQYKLTYLFYTTTQKKRVYDLTFLWEQQFTKLAEELINKHNIKNFIVSVSPHYYALYASRLKKKHPDLNLIIDFRDPWLTLRDFGLQTMSLRQQENERKIISEIVKNADYLISPSSFVLDEFKSYTNQHEHFIEVPHAFDWDDVKEYLETKESKSETTSGKMKFIYPGTLYTDILPSLLKLNEVLSYLKENENSVYSKLEFDFYVDELHYNEYFKEHPCVHFYKPIGKKIFKKVSESSIILILYAEHNKNYRTTKFYEFLPFQKSYLYIGPKGDTYSFIQKYQLGNSYLETVSSKIMAEYFVQLVRDGIRYDPLIDYNNYSFSKQTDNLISLFK